MNNRNEDIEPNLDYELRRFAAAAGKRVTFNKEARSAFLKFATSPSASWTGNFRDLNAAVIRMATLASGGRINEGNVAEEVERLTDSWRQAEDDPDDQLLAGVMGEKRVAAIDHFERHQLAEVIGVCRQAKSLSAAGRALFQVSRMRKKQPNDADRLRKYLAKHGLRWESI